MPFEQLKKAGETRTALKAAEKKFGGIAAPTVQYKGGDLTAFLKRGIKGFEKKVEIKTIKSGTAAGRAVFVSKGETSTTDIKRWFTQYKREAGKRGNSNFFAEGQLGRPLLYGAGAVAIVGGIALAGAAAGLSGASGVTAGEQAGLAAGGIAAKSATAGGAAITAKSSGAVAAAVAAKTGVTGAAGAASSIFKSTASGAKTLATETARDILGTGAAIGQAKLKEKLFAPFLKSEQPEKLASQIAATPDLTLPFFNTAETPSDNKTRIYLAIAAGAVIIILLFNKKGKK